MEFLAGFWNYVVVFLFILTVVVFIHEGGHYLVARWNGVKVEVFSIGFGPELFGWNDKSGTRWRVAALPLGGYVRMFGDGDAASATGTPRELTDDEKAISFKHKRVGQRAAIVFAGPAANFIFAIVGLALMFMISGRVITEPVVGEVAPDLPAQAAGIMAGDIIREVNGEKILRFQDIQRAVRLHLDQPLTMTLERSGELISIGLTPKIIEREGMFGDKEQVPVLGIRAAANQTSIQNFGPGQALVEAVAETKNMISATFVGIGQIITGVRDSEELGGPIRIAKGAGEAAQLGIASIMFYMILLSLNLGLINLFPIPVLDGGHLVFYAVEAVLGRPLGEKAQEYSFRIGLFLVLALMLFATRNDIVTLPIWDTIKRSLS